MATNDQQSPSSDQSSDPPIYKHLNPKTRGLLHTVNQSIKKEEDAKAQNQNNMSGEQTYVQSKTKPHYCDFIISEPVDQITRL